MRVKHPYLAAIGAVCALVALGGATDLVTTYYVSGDAGRVSAFVGLCPSSDGSRTAVDCRTSGPGTTAATPSYVQDSNSAGYTDWPVISAVSGTYTPPTGTRSIALTVTTAGNLTLTSTVGNVMTFPVTVGFQTLPFVPATFTATATATFWGVK